MSAVTTIRAALSDAYRRLEPVSPSARLDAQVLLCAVLDVSRAHVLAYGERELTAEQADRFDDWLSRRANGEPVAYILGRRAFFDRDLIVTPDVLIPRPETEHLLEEALACTAERPALTAVDVGTGSGALAVTFKAHRPTATVYATDISAAALRVAARNAADLDITFLAGDLLTPLIERDIRVDLIMANLPYIASDDVARLAVSRHEPHLALDGGADGLDLVRRLLDQAPDVTVAGAIILLEIGAGQGSATMALARERFAGASVRLISDYAGHDRVVCVALAR